MVALCMGAHTRLGEASLLRHLDPALLELTHTTLETKQQPNTILQAIPISARISAGYLVGMMLSTSVESLANSVWPRRVRVGQGSIRLTPAFSPAKYRVLSQAHVPDFEPFDSVGHH
eukprot:2274455-Rhodomonas_salina.1